jgi:hypothetical protein
MTPPELAQVVGMVAAVALPFWNIPLIWRIQKRRSADDLSPAWALGVWVCLIGMLPSGLASSDTVFKTFTVVNLGLFSCVVIQMFRFRR